MRSRKVRIGLWILLGLAVRGLALQGDGLWCDEGYTAWTAHLSAEDHRRAREHDDAPPLYYALQRIVVPNLPPHEGSVRLLSAAAGVAGVAWLAVAPPVSGVVEAPVAFLAVGTYGVLHARQARSYGLLMLWGLILMTATARVLDGRRRWLAVVAASEALALWTHNVAAPLIVGANLAWLLCGRRDPLRWLTAQAAAFLLWLPLLARSLPQFAVHGELNRWIGEYWEGVPIAAAPLLSLASFTSGARVVPVPPADRWSYAGPGATILAVLAFLAVAVLLACAFRRRSRREGLLAASFTLGPLVTLAGLSMVTSPAYILARTDAVGYGGFVVWAALGLRGLPRWGKIPLIAVLAASTLLATATRFPVSGHQRDNDRRVGRFLQAEVAAGDWVAFTGLARPSIDYYLSGGRPGVAGDEIHRIHFPASSGANPAGVYPTPGDSLRAWESEAMRVRDRFEGLERADGRPAHLYFVGAIVGPGVREPTAEDLPYPANVLAYVLNGLRPLNAVQRLPGDGIRGEWIVFQVRSDALIAKSELQPIEVAR
jgi:hypothetical protein